MHALLAQASPDANAIASWLSVLFYFGGFIATLIGAAVGIKTLKSSDKAAIELSGQPLEIRAAATFATKEEHKKLEAEVAKVDAERRQSVAGLHKKIDENTSMTAGIEGQLRGMNQQLQQINIHLINRANK